MLTPLILLFVKGRPKYLSHSLETYLLLDSFSNYLSCLCFFSKINTYNFRPFICSGLLLSIYWLGFEMFIFSVQCFSMSCFLFFFIQMTNLISFVFYCIIFNICSLIFFKNLTNMHIFYLLMDYPDDLLIHFLLYLRLLNYFISFYLSLD